MQKVTILIANQTQNFASKYEISLGFSTCVPLSPSSEYAVCSLRLLFCPCSLLRDSEDGGHYSRPVVVVVYQRPQHAKWSPAQTLKGLSTIFLYIFFNARNVTLKCNVTMQICDSSNIKGTVKQNLIIFLICHFSRYVSLRRRSC